MCCVLQNDFIATKEYSRFCHTSIFFLEGVVAGLEKVTQENALMKQRTQNQMLMEVIQNDGSQKLLLLLKEMWTQETQNLVL